ncbi:hypothetical protein KKG29_03520 [Patescibacteria group bacterium]|nr:hypothetical protein [Patescibacteria group bacterium]MBU4000212.1 hypothetical protein [Patescibacteria group bacterium]MBU4056622.1 hypothetical protein [Patescibacteria group bacterium]MBU4368649.1 hypothetical protein [Patescibacteria group bacterium]
MTENKTVREMIDEAIREMIDEAIGLYDKGEWNAALELLEITFQSRYVNNKEAAEIHMLAAWNHWKRGKKDLAASVWATTTQIAGADNITIASSHAGLGIYYAEKGDKEKALHHAKLAQELLPPNVTMNHAMNLNACAISLAKIGELDRAEEVLRKVAQINEQLEKSDDPVVAKKAKHQRAKNGYNLASLVYIPQEKYREAIVELDVEVIPRYKIVNAETDIAAAYHRIAEAYEKMAETGNAEKLCLTLALDYENASLTFWQKHPDDPKRIETAEKNILRIKEKIAKLEH